MAYRCTSGDHGKCTACESIVLPYERDHVHIFRGGGAKHDTLCSNCWLKTVYASLPIFRALNNVGFITKEFEPFREYIHKHVIVGIDVEFDFADTRTN